MNDGPLNDNYVIGTKIHVQQDFTGVKIFYILCWHQLYMNSFLSTIFTTVK